MSANHDTQVSGDSVIDTASIQILSDVLRDDDRGAIDGPELSIQDSGARAKLIQSENFSDLDQIQEAKATSDVNQIRRVLAETWVQQGPGITNSRRSEGIRVGSVVSIGRAKLTKPVLSLLRGLSVGDVSILMGTLSIAVWRMKGTRGMILSSSTSSVKSTNALKITVARDWLAVVGSEAPKVTSVAAAPSPTTEAIGLAV
jgi:hypothetical protein